MMNNSKIEVQVKQASIREIDSKALTDAERTKVDKIDALNNLLQSHTIDDSRTLLGSEPFFIPVFNESEQFTIKAKLMEIINTL